MLLLCFLSNCILTLCVCVCVHMGHRAYVKVRRQLKDSILFPLFVTQGSNLGCQAWQQAPLPTILLLV